MPISEYSWLLNLLGVDEKSIPSDAKVEIIWTNLPSSWGWFVLIGLVLAGAYVVYSLYRREIDTCPTWAKFLLGGLRLGVLLLLLVVLLGPALVYTQLAQLKPFIVVLRDSSLSMKTKDRYLNDDVAQPVADVLGTSIEGLRDSQPSRVDVLSAALEKNDRKFLRELEYRGKVKVVDFSNRLEEPVVRQPRQRPEETATAANKPEKPAEESPVEPLPPLKADGQGTDIFKALADGFGERNTAAVILFSEGQHTAKDSGRDQILTLARQEGKPPEDRIPVFVVGVGDPHKPRNLAMTDVYADPQVFPEEPFEIRAVLRGQDVGQTPVTVELIQQSLSADGTPVGQPQVVETRRDLQIPESGKLDLTFSANAGKPGLYSYKVRVEEIENEANSDDNQPESPTLVKVLDDKARVLLIAGAPTWEYRMVQRLLTAEPSVDLSCWLQTLDVDRAQEGDTAIKKLPTDKKELFNYDVVMLFDPDPAEFDEKWVDLLKSFVSEHAGGVLYMAGPKFSGRFLGSGRTKNMRDVLPVQLGDVGRADVDNLLANNTRAWPLSAIEANVDQAIMRFDADPTASLQRWRTLPGIFWSFPSEGPKPAARVLIEHSAPEMRDKNGSRPLLVTGQYGSGRTVYLGFNGTWRWRKVGRNAEFFKRFWVQTVRYLIEGRSLEGRRRGYVETEKSRYQLGDQVEIVARDLKDENFNHYTVPEIQGTIDVDGADSRSITLRQVPNQPGVYQATFTPRQTGRHLLKVSMPDVSAGEVPKVEAAFSVTMPTVETNEVALNKALLVDVANASGGKYFEINQIDDLPSQIPERIRETEHRSKPRPLWDNRLMLLLLVALLSGEWAVRKAYKLM